MSQAPNKEILWEATDPQDIALTTYADFILFGGSRGGGKTDTALHWLVEPVHIPEYRGLVIRRNATDLADFIDRAWLIWRHWGVKKAGNPATFKFPSGAVIYSGHLADKDSYTKYMGWELQRILIEELTHIPSLDLFNKLMGSLRSTILDLPAQFMGNTNPGGVGNEWVKEYWHIADDEYPVAEEFLEDEVYKIYIPANIDSNPHLALADPKYVKWLQNLPPELRAKWYEGSWEDIDTENQYYASRIKKLKDAGHITVVPIEAGLRTFTAFDLGISDQMVLWTYQVHGKELRIVDCYANRNQPLKHYSDYLYSLRDEFNITIDTIFVPHDANVRSMTSDTLMTRYEKLVELGHNVEMIPQIGVDDGIDAVREILSSCWIDEKRTHDGVRALRAYQREFDEKMNRYKDKPLHDWASDYADSFRYLALSLPLIGSGQISPVAQLQRENFKKHTNTRQRRRR